MSDLDLIRSGESIRESMVVNSTQIVPETDLADQAKKVKISATDKLRELKRNFETRNITINAEINSIKVWYDLSFVRQFVFYTAEITPLGRCLNNFLSQTWYDVHGILSNRKIICLVSFLLDGIRKYTSFLLGGIR